MKKIVAFAVAFVFGLGSVSVMAADTAGKGGTAKESKAGKAKKGTMDDTKKSDKAKAKSKSGK